MTSSHDSELLKMIMMQKGSQLLFEIQTDSWFLCKNLLENSVGIWAEILFLEHQQHWLVLKTGAEDSPIFRVTVIMFRDIVDSVIVLKDEH